METSTTNTAALPLVQTTAPERIYLAVSDEEYDRDRRFLEHDEIGWSTDEPLAVCVPYVRADLATLTQQQGGEQEAGGGWTPQLMDELLACMDGWGLIIGERSVRHGDTWAWEMKDAAALIRTLRSKQPAASEGDGLPFGIIDPDYARIYTQARVLAWSEGYALTLHGSFTRDLDLVAVPWTDSACEPEHLVRRLAEVAELRLRDDDPSTMPHGRLAWTLRLPGFGEPRWVDFGVMPRTTDNTSKQPAGD